MSNNSTVRLKFIDGETLDFPFQSEESALEFYHRAQKRDDTASVRFIDPALKNSYAREMRKMEND